jgi:hypothetical protein
MAAGESVLNRRNCRPTSAGCRSQLLLAGRLKWTHNRRADLALLAAYGLRPVHTSGPVLETSGARLHLTRRHRRRGAGAAVPSHCLAMRIGIPTTLPCLPSPQPATGGHSHTCLCDRIRWHTAGATRAPGGMDGCVPTCRHPGPRKRWSRGPQAVHRQTKPRLSLEKGRSFSAP